MRRPCDTCGRSYDAKRPTSKYCSDTCRVRKSRGAGQPTVVAEPVAPVSSGLVAAVQSELTAAGRLESVLGQQAQALAQRITTTVLDASVASLSRELREVMDAALKSSAKADPLDELRARRERRLSS